MIFKKFTVVPHETYAPPYPGSFDGHSVTVGKVYLGIFAGQYRGVRVNKSVYNSAYKRISGECPEKAQNKIDSAARAIAQETFNGKSVRELYVNIHAVWTGGKWRFVDPTDADITTNGDGIRIQADIVEVSPACAKYPGYIV